MFFIIATILSIALLVALAIAVFGPGPKEFDRGYRGTQTVPGVKKPAAIAAGVIALLLVAFTVAMSATTVSPRAVGIQTSFGRYVDTLDAGFHWTTPWSNVEEFSTLAERVTVENQPVSFAGTVGADGKTTGSGGSGAADVSARWGIDPDDKGGAEKLWRKYKTYENVRDSLVIPTLREGTRVVVGKYTPVTAKDGSNVLTINQGVNDHLVSFLADDGIVIDGVNVTDVSLGKSAQNSLNKIVEANANIDRARSEKQRAGIDADTARIRQGSGSLTGPALTRLCLDVTNSWDAEKNGPLPAGWSCVAGGSGVLVASK